MNESTARSNPLLAATGQSVVLKTCGVLIAIAAVMVALLNRGYRTAGIEVFSAGALMMLGSVSYALRRIACPICRTPWLQHALGETSINGWLIWLLTFTECRKYGLCAGTLEDGKRNKR